MSQEDRIITNRRDDGRPGAEPPLRQSGYDQREGYEETHTRMIGDPAAHEAVISARPRADRRERDAFSLEMPKAYGVDEDRARWGPVWAGFFTATTAMILLGLLGVAIGLSVSEDPGWARGDLRAATTGSAIWGGVSGVVSFFVGGWVAARMSAIFSRGWGAWNGALVFMLSLPITLVLASSGLGSLFGAVGQLAPALNIYPGSIAAQDLSMRAIRSALASTAWWSLIGMVVALVAAAVGGALGTRRRIPIDRLTGSVQRDRDRAAA